jgi:hypothetical protein
MTGSCLCGAVRYRADGELTFVHHCHCVQCRKHHGTAFSTCGLVPAASFRWSSGEDVLRAYQVPGAHFTRLFCGTCGSSLGGRDDRVPDSVIIAAGTLDDPPSMKPFGHIYVGSKAPWYPITDALPQFATWPEEPC